MTEVKPLRQYSQAQKDTLKQTSAQDPVLRIVTKEKPNVNLESLDWIKEQKERTQAKNLQEKYAERDNKLRTQLTEAFRVVNQARKLANIHTLPDFVFSENESSASLEKKFSQTTTGIALQKADAKDKERIIENNICFSELEHRLFHLFEDKVFDTYHITEMVNDYRQQVMKVGRGYKTTVSPSHQTPITAINNMLKNPFYEIKSQEQAIEFIYLAKARGLTIPSPVWEENSVDKKKVSLLFSQLYLKQLETCTAPEAKQKAVLEAQKSIGLVIPPVVFNSYLQKVIKAPYLSATAKKANKDA